MVKVVFENNNINDIFNGTAELSISGDRKQATYADDLTEGQLVFRGSNFVRDGDSSYMSSGTIHKLLITDENNDFAFKLTGAHIKAKDLPHDFTGGDLAGLMSVMLAGKDRIIGSDSNDYLYGYGRADRITGGIGDDDITGGRGNDVMTGGSGTDTFHFTPSNDGRSHDVITDFDVVGPEVDHFNIMPYPSVINSIEAVHNGRDTLLTLEGNSSVLLENVRKDDLLEYFTHL